MLWFYVSIFVNQTILSFLVYFLTINSTHKSKEPRCPFLKTLEWQKDENLLLSEVYAVWCCWLKSILLKIILLFYVFNKGRLRGNSSQFWLYPKDKEKTSGRKIDIYIMGLFSKFKYNFDSIENERLVPDACSPSTASMSAYRPRHILPRPEPHSKLQLRTACFRSWFYVVLYNPRVDLQPPMQFRKYNSDLQ